MPRKRPFAVVALTTFAALWWPSPVRADDASTLESGINSYEGSRYQECVQRFRGMLTPGSPTTLSDQRLKNRARMYYVTCLTATRRGSEADEQMKQLVREDTRYIPDRAAFPGAVLDRFTEIRVVMKTEIDRLERERIQQEQEEEQRQDNEKKRAVVRLRQLEAYARTETVVHQNSRWLALLPFGVGQFQNGQIAFGWTLLGTEVAFGAASIVTALVKNQLESNFDFGRSDSAQAEQRRSLMVTLNRVSFGVLAATAVAGILHAQLTFVDEARKTRERKLPPNFLWMPVVAPRVGGGTVGVKGTFLTMRIVVVTLLALASCSRPGSGKSSPSTDRAMASAPAGTSGGARPSASAPPAPAEVGPVKHVLLLTVDALRADQPWTGYTYGHTPALDRLAARSLVYTRVYSVANHTTPSLAGLLSGRYPSELVRDRCALTHYQFTGGLASFLAEAGVYTFAAHGHAIFAGKTRPAAGFKEWRVLSRAAGMRVTEGGVTGDDIAALLVTFLRGRATMAEGRFFAWAHFVDPHDAYVHHDAFPPSSHSKRGAYDGEVAYEDHVLGGVLDVLEETGLAKDTAVIVSADHGEAFGEHGFFRHGFSMYDEEIRVPFLLSIPGVPPRRFDQLRSAIDVAPTIAALYGFSPPPIWRGQSLLEDLTTAVPRSRHALVDTPEVDTRHPLQAVITEGHKVMLQGRTGRVFDLRADPEEKTEITGEAAQAAVDFARNMTAALEPAPSTPCGLSKEK